MHASHPLESIKTKTIQLKDVSSKRAASPNAHARDTVVISSTAPLPPVVVVSERQGPSPKGVREEGEARPKSLRV